MFAKILKWDLLNQKAIPIMLAISVMVTLVGGLLKLTGSEIIWSIGLFIVGAIILAITIITSLYPAYYTAKSLFGSQAYIQHSVPANSATLWHSKIVSGMIYNMLSMLVFWAEVYFLFYVYSEGAVNYYLRVLFTEGVSKVTQFIGVSVPVFWLLLLGTFVVGIISVQVMYGFVVIFGNHKALQKQGAIRYFISYVVYYVITQAVTFAAMVLIPVTIVIDPGMTGLNPTWHLEMQSIFGAISSGNQSVFSLGSFFVGFLLSFGLYWYCRRQLSRHFNLL